MQRDAQLRTEILELVRDYYQQRFASREFRPGVDLIHYAGRVFDAQELVNLVDSSLDVFLTANRNSESLEADFADFFGLPNSLLVNSGS